MQRTKTISIDHGNRLIKTTNFAFSSSFIKSDHLPMLGNTTIKYEGNEYAFVNKLLPQLDNKTEDDRYFILTLFAIGQELVRDEEKFRIFHAPNEIINIKLLIGLPLENCRDLGSAYVRYFKTPFPVRFEFNKKVFIIQVTEVKEYPQGLAAAYSILDKLKDSRMVNIVDVGGFTVDCARLVQLNPDLTINVSLQYGVNVLFNNINKTSRSSGGKDIPVDMIEAVLLKEPDALKDISPKRHELITSAAKVHAETLLSKVSNEGCDLEEDKTIFMGGGSILLRDYLLEVGKVKRPVMVDDIHANAKGYKFIYDMEAASKKNNVAFAG
jgi:plasmid segregation protein ParM